MNILPYHPRWVTRHLILANLSTVTRRVFFPSQWAQLAINLLTLHSEDEVLRRLEAYRLYQAGYAARDMAEAFDYVSPHLVGKKKPLGLENNQKN
jgi:hypothetical protein